MPDPVSRETPSPPPVPAVAERVFSPERLPLIERYAASLADVGVVRGLIGPREVPRLWERHLLNCAVLGDAIPEGMSVCDVGTGAGLPGLVLAIARPDLQITLVEPLLRRTTYLDEVVEAWELTNVHVVRGRAESLHRRQRFDVVTSRAVAPLDRLLEWSMPLVGPTGVLLAMKGSTVSSEIEKHRAALEAWGCEDPEVIELGADLVDPPTIALRVAWADPEKVRWEVGAEPQGVSRGASKQKNLTKSRARRGRKG